MNAAAELFIKHGFHGIDSKQIARHAGVSTGSFYVYFHDKKDVFIAVVWERVQHTIAAMREYIDTWDRSRDPREIMLGLIALTREHLSPELFREVTILQYHDPDVSDLQKKTVQIASDLLLPFIKSLGSGLKVKDLEAGITMLILTVIEIVHTTTTFSHMITPDRTLNELADMIHRYFWGDS